MSNFKSQVGYAFCWHAHVRVQLHCAQCAAPCALPTAPCTTAPYTTAPCTIAPCTTAPCTTAPCTTAPCTTAPCTTAPCMTAPLHCTPSLCAKPCDEAWLLKFDRFGCGTQFLEILLRSEPLQLRRWSGRSWLVSNACKPMLTDRTKDTATCTRNLEGIHEP